MNIHYSFFLDEFLWQNLSYDVQPTHFDQVKFSELDSVCSKILPSLQDAKALNVIIDPGLAFGTGEHPTTRLCLQWLHHVVSPGDKILDYGTGSGILSIAALKVNVCDLIFLLVFFSLITQPCFSTVFLTKLGPSR